MLDANKIYIGDTIELMKKMDDKSVDLVITSPPYNSSVRKDNHKYPGGNYEDDLSEVEYVDWSLKVFKEYERILNDKGVIAYNMSYNTFFPSLMYKTIAKVLSDTNLMIADTIVWKKKSAVPLAGHPNRVTRICEFVYIFVKKDHLDDFNCNKIVSAISVTNQKYFKTYYNFLETKNNDGSTEIHKATFSTDFAKFFVDLYSFPGSLVLDNFMGTGTSAIACIDLDRQYIGMDMSQEYVDFSNERIKNHQKNTSPSEFTPAKSVIKSKLGEPKPKRAPRKKVVKEEIVQEVVKEEVNNEIVQVQEVVKEEIKIEIKKESEKVDEVDDFWT
jgi:DNA modification methylase